MLRSKYFVILISFAILIFSCTSDPVIQIIDLPPEHQKPESVNLPIPEVDDAVLTKLLDGVSNIAIDGVPGEIVVFGEKTVPVLIDQSGRSMAALYSSDNQSILFLGHSSWLDPDVLKRADNGRFMKNALELVSKEGKILFIQAAGILPIAQENGISADSAKLIPEDLSNYSAVVINFRTFGSGVLSDAEIDNLQNFLNNGGSCIGFGIGWVFNSYGEGKYGAGLVDSYSANIILSPFGAAWGNRYASAEAVPNFNPVSGHLLPVVEKALKGLYGESDYSEAENKAVIQNLLSYDVNRAAAIAAIPADSLDFLYDYLNNGSVVTIPDLDNPVSLSDTASIMGIAFSHLLYIQDKSFNSSRTYLPEERPEEFLNSLRAFPSYGVKTNIEQSKTINVHADEKGWISTGVYALPGKPVRFKADSDLPPLRIRIGAHHDNLFNSRRSKWYRWPEITSVHGFTDGEAEIVSPFGGIIYFLPIGTPESRDNSVIQIEGAAPYPLFQKGITSDAEWKEMVEETDVPWAEIITDKFIITTLVSETQGIDLNKVCDFWNKALTLYPDLSGFSFSGVSADSRSFERIVFDAQISMGFMHSGYPIMADLTRAGTVLRGAAADSFDTDAASMWGFLHELGHNWQKRDYTMSYAGEVTVNIFTLYAMEKMMGVKPIDHPMPISSAGHKLEDYWKNPDPAAFRNNPFLGLHVYIYLLDEFGWEVMKEVLRDFDSLPSIPANDTAKEDYWAYFYSLRSGRNLVPYFKRWGFTVSEKTKEYAADLRLWMPVVMK